MHWMREIFGVAYSNYIASYVYTVTHGPTNIAMTPRIVYFNNYLNTKQLANYIRIHFSLIINFGPACYIYSACPMCMHVARSIGAYNIAIYTYFLAYFT